MSEFCDIPEIGHPVEMPKVHNFQNIINMEYGRLKCIEYRGSLKRTTYWLFQCQCGTYKVIRSNDVKNGSSQSCGCLLSETTTKNKTKHGLRYLPEYKTLMDMIARCYNPNNKHYHRYGGRGIRICQRWLNSKEDFIEDMGPKPTPKHSIDRIDVNGDYTPENCRWATSEEQNNNRRDNHHIEYNGETKTASQWGRVFNIHPTIITGRLKLGWSIDEALNTKVEKRNKN